MRGFRFSLLVVSAFDRICVGRRPIPKQPALSENKLNLRYPEYVKIRSLWKHNGEKSPCLEHIKPSWRAVKIAIDTMTGQPLVLTWENVRFLRVISSWFLRRDRLRVVSLFSWSVEQNARDTQMTTRVSERRFAARRSRARSLPLTKSEKKKKTARSLTTWQTGQGMHLIQSMGKHATLWC